VKREREREPAEEEGKQPGNRFTLSAAHRTCQSRTSTRAVADSSGTTMKSGGSDAVDAAAADLAAFRYMPIA